jgi:hypothetical protein
MPDWESARSQPAHASSPHAAQTTAAGTSIESSTASWFA